MNEPVILIVDDSQTARKLLKKGLDGEGYEFLEASNGTECMHKIREDEPDLVLLDYVMPGGDGITVLERIQNLDNPPIVIMQTARGSEEVAVSAIKKGAYDYLKKPCETGEILVTIEKALERKQLEQNNQRFSEELQAYRDSDIIGESEPIIETRNKIEQVAPTPASVVITGESGTGKELVAKQLHKFSLRDGPFLTVDCASLPENLIQSELFGHEKGAYTGAKSQRIGKFERAEGGTIFLDEIGEMSLETQKLLLRVLEEEEVERLGGDEKIPIDARIVCATNKNLSDAVEEGTFRKDLYYRIKVVHFHLPPLRERGNDRTLLAQYFLKQFKEQYNCPGITLSERALDAIDNYHWPGNIRELKNVMERAIIICDDDEISRDSLPLDIEKSPDIPTGTDHPRDFQKAKQQVIRNFERTFLTEALKRNDGNISRTADEIGMYRQNLHKKIKKLNISVDQYRGTP